MVRAATATAVNVLVWWGLLFLLYVILISSVPPLELMVGAGFALLGALGAEGIRRAEHPRLRGGRRVATAAAAFPLTLLRETGQLAAAVTRTVRHRGDGGRGLTVTIRLAPEVDAVCAAALLSASPGACVIDMSDAPGTAKDPQTPALGRDLTAHLLLPDPSPVERALGERHPS